MNKTEAREPSIRRQIRPLKEWSPGRGYGSYLHHHPMHLIDECEICDCVRRAMERMGKQ